MYNVAPFLKVAKCSQNDRKKTKMGIKNQEENTISQSLQHLVKKVRRKSCRKIHKILPNLKLILGLNPSPNPAL